ncbi:site-specific integrase [Vagococcus fluvialis]|uniref:tyrosine-type recombinase/integrase n=1 Tax=Vagococcus fluvialis TaxID=2738 RepID=UPI00288FBB25|nr:site-specific integrase [Vagococcus fluvialis]MDT2783030.1 site-specific integrase [Vagococcus fluvialis]
MKAIKKAIENKLEEPIEIEDVVTFVDWYRYWFLSFRSQNIREVTKLKYCVIFNQLVESSLGQMDIKKIKRLDVQTYINNYGEIRSKQTVLDHMQYIRSAFNDAMTEGLITTNPSSNIKMVYKEQRLSPMEQKKLREEKKWLEIDEYQKLKYFLIFNLEEMLEVYDKPGKFYFSKATYYVMIFVAMKTGARVSEILGLTRADINFEKELINIDKTWDYKFNQGFVGTKNFASIREVLIDKETTEILKKYILWLDGSQREMESDLLFVLKDRRVYTSTINNQLYQVLDELEIERISFHKLRHTHASYLIAKEIPLQVVAKRLGHTDTNMIAQVYGHLLEETENRGNQRILELI